MQQIGKNIDQYQVNIFHILFLLFHQMKIQDHMFPLFLTRRFQLFSIYSNPSLDLIHVSKVNSNHCYDNDFTHGYKGMVSAIPDSQSHL